MKTNYYHVINDGSLITDLVIGCGLFILLMAGLRLYQLVKFNRRHATQKEWRGRFEAVNANQIKRSAVRKNRKKNGSPIKV